MRPQQTSCDHHMPLAHDPQTSSLRQSQEAAASERSKCGGLELELSQAERTVGELRGEVASVKQDLQDALELCNEHETLMEERNRELAAGDAEIRCRQQIALLCLPLFPVHYPTLCVHPLACDSLCFSLFLPLPLSFPLSLSLSLFLFLSSPSFSLPLPLSPLPTSLSLPSSPSLSPSPSPSPSSSLSLCLPSRSLKVERESWSNERSRLIAEQQHLASERDQAIAECDRLMARSANTTSEQSELSRQRQQLMAERDQLVAERQAQRTENEKV